MKNNLLMRTVRVIWYIIWSVFVNALSVWMVGPLVKDLAMYGVLAVAAIAVLWLTSLHPSFRRPFVCFTLYSLILGQGLAGLEYAGLTKTIAIGIIIVLGLFIAAVWFGKVRFIPLVFGTVAVIVANAWLPFSDWPFLTQFKVVEQNRMHIQPHDMDAVPFDVIHTKTGDALLTVDGYTPPKDLLKQLVEQATDTPNALENVLRRADGEYRLVELKDVNGQIQRVTPSAEDLAGANPLALIKSFFPFQLAHWYITGGNVAEYLSPYLTSNQAVQAGLSPSTYASTMQALSDRAVDTELSNWKSALHQLGTQPQTTNWVVRQGQLTGVYHGENVSIPVNASSVVGEGHFTSANANQVLLVGDNDLLVVDLAKQKVVATYQGSSTQHVPNDVVIGPLTTGEKDAIFVNASPAYVLTVNAAGAWKQVYTATSASFRFETVLASGNGAPEIITNDPSKVRDAPTRYFSAYRFVPGANGGAGQLERDWRVFRTNVVNVTPVTFQQNGQRDLAVSIYGTGEYLILQKHHIPVLPISLIGFAVILVIGFVIRIWRRKGIKGV